MSVRTRTFVIAALACLAASAAADEPGRYYAGFNASDVPDADFGAAPDAEVSSKNRQVATAFARFEAGTAVIDIGLDYEYTRFKYQRVNSRNRDLHRVQVPVWFSAPLKNWQLRGHVAPGIFTSSNVLKDFFDRGSSDDFYTSARIEAIANDLPWILGVAHDRSFGSSTTYPVVGVSLTPSESVDVRLAWPDTTVKMRFSDRQRASFRVFPAGHQWHVRTDDFTREFDYRYEAWRSQLTWTAGISKLLTIDVSLGYEFDREHLLSDDAGVQISGGASSQWLYAIGFRVGDGPLPLAHGAHLNR